MAESKVLMGKLLAEQVKQRAPNTPFNEVEFSVYSQFGEDGIIQFLIQHLRDAIKHKVFVEIGVQTYVEANTRFLLENNSWSGILIDACGPDIDTIQASDCYQRNNLYAKKAFVTRDNINQLLNEFNLPKEIGLLSLDIDGNDFWVLERLEALNPVILIVEYNSFFGPNAPIAIPYDEKFVWQKAHPAPYFSASLPAFCHLLEKHGYDLICSNSAGNNAFFVRKEINQGKFPALSAEEGYRQATFNLVPCFTARKFDEQVKSLQYQPVQNVMDHSISRFDEVMLATGRSINNSLLSLVD